MSRCTIAKLSSQNLLHNLELIKRQTNNQKIIAMIKANAYGHGLRSVAMRLDNKVYSFGVASIDEALALRKAHIQSSITLMYGPSEARDIIVSSYQNFSMVLHENEQINWLNNINLVHPIKVWLDCQHFSGQIVTHIFVEFHSQLVINNH